MNGHHSADELVTTDIMDTNSVSRDVIRERQLVYGTTLPYWRKMAQRANEIIRNSVLSLAFSATTSSSAPSAAAICNRHINRT